MTFLDQALVPGERLTYRARLHWMVFAPALALAIVGTLLFIWVVGYRWVGGLVVGVGAVMAVKPYLLYRFSEFGVTDRRVLVKLGLVGRESMDQLLDKVETVQVDQDIPGRLLGYGSVTVMGTGGTRETFARIADPFGFRRAIQERVIALHGPVGSAPATPAVPARLERKCPWCAEMILVDARVCKHCGRSVPAA
jgi:hypothetical protein